GIGSYGHVLVGVGSCEFILVGVCHLEARDKVSFGDKIHLLPQLDLFHICVGAWRNGQRKFIQTWE
ncbi:hypothetical protein, partial [Alteromonas stellipolaris]|uniref:hypothetical protein n=1 Tax=Alteromonas stellipolaris TaxID=233316 RepID=UPI001E188E5A